MNALIPDNSKSYCKGVTSHGKCGCTNFIPGRRIAFDTECANCPHVAGTHGSYDYKAPKTSESDSEGTSDNPVPTTPSKLISVSQARISPVNSTLTPKEARAILIAHGVKVGERGRLSPAQMNQAETLKNGGK